MARVTVEDCLDNVETRFKLVLVAAKRARQLSNGAEANLDWDNDKPTVMALREIAEGFVDETILDETVKQEESSEESFEITEARMQEVVKELSEVMPTAAVEEKSKAAAEEKPKAAVEEKPKAAVEEKVPESPAE